MFELIHSIRERDPAKPGFWEVFFSYPGYHAITWHRLAHKVWALKLKGLARFISHLGRMFTGIEIHPAATIGQRVFIDHGMGVVIGETAVIRDDVTLYHGVTLGGKGIGKAGEKRHPTLERNVMIGAGAQILGNITVGENARVGANSVVTHDVPSGCTAIGNPSRFINCDSPDGAYGLPKDDFIDPVSEVIDGIINDINKIKKEINLKTDKEKEKQPDKNYIDMWKGSGI